MVTYNGENIFGSAVQFQHIPRPRAQQEFAFFGVSGTQVLDGGGRGRDFFIRGVLTASSLAALDAAEARFRDYADGIARDLVDNRGRIWPNVIFKGEFVPDARGAVPGGSGWALPYRAVFHGLT
ncbi:hypothetical protein [Paludisphaera mucosa]|uniref:Uncharacterized protein n=1 Tax=Paludisphaera mucosa TaxID=3030827 RepID=A0ABT6FD39_9BACT|nr:hypothetical protein [Paludisphaera mucosa]MDG3005497.1 hypothetical protein [Paludisphaera mucosa]